MKYINRAYLIACLLGVLCLFSFCKKEATISIPHEKISVDVEGDFRSLHFFDENNGWIAGGGRYDKPVLIKTSDGGESFTTVNTGLFTGIFDIDFLNEQKGIVVAYDGWIAQTVDGGLNWQNQRLEMPSEFMPLRSVQMLNDSIIAIVGGVAYEIGVIATSYDSGSNWEIAPYENELRDLHFTDTQTAYACAYGEVIKSEDQASTWKPLDIDGDYFTDLFFVDDNMAFVVGYFGSILKTVNAGQDWEKIKKGNIYAPHFEKIVFKDEAEGYIAGDGLLWQSIDGGDTWKTIEGMGDYSFRDLQHIGNDEWIVVGDNALIVRL